jgi:hypothetical protein
MKAKMAEKRDLSARPELGPTFGDPQGETGEAAVLRAISEGRHSTKDPLTGNWKWALRDGYALEGSSGRLQLTYNGKQHLASLDEKSGRAEADRERADVSDMDEPEAVRAALSKIADSGKEEAENADQSAAPERPQGPEPAAVQSTEPERELDEWVQARLQQANEIYERLTAAAEKLPSGVVKDPA